MIYKHINYEKFTGILKKLKLKNYRDYCKTLENS